MFLLYDKEENGSKPWYTKHLESLFSRPDFLKRRNLAESPGESPAPSSSVGSPFFSPAPSSGPAPTSSPVPNTQRPAGPPLPFFPPNFNDSTLQPTVGEQSPDSASNVGSNNKKSNRRTIVIAVVVTATVTFSIALVLFLCYCRVCRNRTVRRNDENPLLSLSLSDYSIGMYIYIVRFSFC